MLAQGGYQVDSASERIKPRRERARAGGKRNGGPSALILEQVKQCRDGRGGAGLLHIARVMQCSPATVKKAWVSQPGPESFTHPLGG